MESSTHLGYGFKITDKKLSAILAQGDQELDLYFDVMSHGDSEGNNPIVLIAVADSCKVVYSFDKPLLLKIDTLNIDYRWDEKLKAWAKKFNIENPKIGWWLCSSV